MTEHRASQDDPTYLMWSAERIMLLIQVQEERRSYLEKKAILWCSGLLTMLGVLIPSLSARSNSSISPLQEWFYGAGLFITLLVFVQTFRVGRAQITKGVRAEQFAGEEATTSATSGTLVSVNRHLAKVHSDLVAELNAKGVRVLSVQALALCGASCYLVGGYVATIGV